MIVEEDKQAAAKRAWEVLRRAQATLLQAAANDATSRGLLRLVADLVDELCVTEVAPDALAEWYADKQCITEVEPDTLEMWDASNDDATGGCTIAGHVELQLEEDEHKTIGTHARCEADGSVNGRTAVGKGKGAKPEAKGKGGGKGQGQGQWQALPCRGSVEAGARGNGIVEQSCSERRHMGSGRRTYAPTSDDPASATTVDTLRVVQEPVVGTEDQWTHR